MSPAPQSRPVRLLLAAVCTCAAGSAAIAESPLSPSDRFDLGNWKITVPLDLDGNEKIDEISVSDIQGYSHPDFFYLNEQEELVFTAPNKAITTPNSSNTRSELRQMLRGTNTDIGTHAPGNNFSLQANPAGEILGGKLSATLRINHVATRAGHAEKYPAYSMVVGQIHAVKNKEQLAEGRGFGHGNEPLKIYYKKWPEHETGSVFWNYERNLAREDADRTDITHVVWGNDWDDPAAPGDAGLALGEEFSYEVNVHGNIMSLTFEGPNKETRTFEVDLASNVDANGVVDEKDNPMGYAEDLLYFKAGAYNQCSTRDAEGFWYAACPGTGDWSVDKANGDYASATFSKLELSAGSQH